MRKVAEPQRTKVFEFILKFKAEHDGNSPSHREIADACDLSSTSVVAHCLDALENEKLIAREYVKTNVFGKFTKSRNIRVVGGKWNPPTASATVAVQA
jgi:SOS-response transcriptional repressor LexA